MKEGYFQIVYPPGTRFVVLQNGTIWCARCFESPHRGYLETHLGVWERCPDCDGVAKKR